MTNKKRQLLLAYLDYYSGDIDGIWGPKSQQGIKAFQHRFGGLKKTGQPDEDTDMALRHAVSYGMPERDGDDFWTEIEYFTRNEFKCTCGGRDCDGFPAEPRERLVRNAEAARKHFGRPSTVSSGVRCALRNSELPGSAANSLHLTGRAMDFRVEGISSAALLAYVKTLPDVHEAYAIDNSYVHMGVEKY